MTSEKQPVDVSGIAAALRGAVSAQREMERRIETLKRDRENILYAPLPVADTLELLTKWVDAQMERGRARLGRSVRSIRASNGRFWREERSRCERSLDFLLTGPVGAKEIDTDALYLLMGE